VEWDETGDSARCAAAPRITASFALMIHALLVDDDAELRTLVADYLQHYGMRVTTVASGAALRRMLPSALPGTPGGIDVLLLDLMLPDEGGLDLLPMGARERLASDHHADGARRSCQPHRRPRTRRRRLPAQALRTARTGGAHQRGAATCGPESRAERRHGQRAGRDAALQGLDLRSARAPAQVAAAGGRGLVSNLSQVSLASDNVFSDGATLEMPTITGSVSAGYAIALTVGIAA